MKYKALLSLCLAAIITATGTVGSAGRFAQTPLNAAAADDANDDWLHCEGSRIYDKDGNEVWLTGANWFGFNCSENCAHGLYAADVDDMLATIADHGINVLRFPISSTLLKSWMAGSPHKVSSVQASYTPPQDVEGEDGKITPAGYYTNINKDFVLEDGKTIKNSMEIFDIIMQKCKKYGLKAFIDIHSPDENNSGHDYELWYGKAGITTKDWQDTLVWLAKKYANDDTLIGYDLKNEPHGKRAYADDGCPSTIAKWDDSKDENNWAYAATNCAEAILDVNPNALIFIEGIEQYPMTEKGYTFDTPDVWEPKSEDEKRWYGAWWGGNLRGVKDYPIKMSTPAKQSQIVYSPHDYGPSVYAQTWFDKNFTEETLLDDYWRGTWAYINEQDIAPLLIGEWGGFVDGTKNQKWMELLSEYMTKHHINHTYWCLNPNSGDTGGLLSHDFLTWDPGRYGILKKTLWQTKSGKFIGLDHKTALGSNGLSLSEYYASGESSNLDAGDHGHATPPVVQQTTQPPVVTTTTAPVTTTTAPVTTTTTVTTTTAPVTTPAVTTTVPADPDSNSFPGYAFQVDVMLMPFMRADNLTEAQKKEAQQKALDIMSKVTRIEVEAVDKSGKSHLIDMSADNSAEPAINSKGNAVLAKDNPQMMQRLVNLADGSVWLKETQRISFAVENLAKPENETRDTVSNDANDKEESGDAGYTVKVKFIAKIDSTEYNLMELEIPRIVMYEKNGNRANYYDHTLITVNLNTIDAPDADERARTLLGYGSNDTGIFSLSKPADSPTAQIQYIRYAPDSWELPEADWGDVNTDGSVDVADAVLLARYLVSDSEAKITSQGITNGAVTNGSTVRTDDVTKILQFIAKMITKDELQPLIPPASIYTYSAGTYFEPVDEDE